MRRRTKTDEQRLKAQRLQRAQNLEAVGLQPEAANLDQQQNVQITRAGERREGRTVKEDSARRLDAFAALKDGMAPGAYDAAKRLERDLHIRFGLHDHGRKADKVDCDPSATDRTDAMIEAGLRVDRVMGHLPPRDRQLFRELILPTHHATWRAAVASITEETTPHGQASAVRAACVNLRDAYWATERRAA